MATHVAQRLASGVATPIAQLHPELKDQATRTIHGEVTITWPYNSIHKTFAFLLAEPDFRLRCDKGLVRIQLDGPSAEAIGDWGLGNGDEVTLSLDGVDWAKDDEPARPPGSRQDWQLKFAGKLVLKVTLGESEETKFVHIDQPVSTEPTQQIEPVLPIEVEQTIIELESEPENENEQQPQLIPVVDQYLPYYEYKSPALIKRSRVAFGELFEDGEDGLEDDGGRKSKGRKRPRYSVEGGMWRVRGDSPSPEPEVREETPSPMQEDTADVEIQTSPAKPQMTDGGCQTVESDLPATPQKAADLPIQNGYAKAFVSSNEVRNPFATTADMGVQSDLRTVAEDSNPDWRAPEHSTVTEDSNKPPLFGYVQAHAGLPSVEAENNTLFGTAQVPAVPHTASQHLFGTAPAIGQLPHTQEPSFGAAQLGEPVSLADQVRFGFSHYPQTSYPEVQSEPSQTCGHPFGGEHAYPESYLDRERSQNNASPTPRGSYDEPLRHPSNHHNSDGIPVSHVTSATSVAANHEVPHWPITSHTMDHSHAVGRMDVNQPLQPGDTHQPTRNDFRSGEREPGTSSPGSISPHVEDGSRNVDEVREQGILSQPIYQQGVPQAALPGLEDQFEDEDGEMSSDEEADYDADQKGDDYDLRNYDRVADDDEGFDDEEEDPPLADDEMMSQVGGDEDVYNEDSFDEEGEDYDDNEEYDDAQENRFPAPQRFAPPIRSQPEVISLISSDDEDDSPPAPPPPKAAVPRWQMHGFIKSEPEVSHDDDMSDEKVDSNFAQKQLDGIANGEPEDDHDDDMGEQADSEVFQSQPHDSETEDMEDPRNARLIRKIDEKYQGSPSYNMQSASEGENNSEIEGEEGDKGSNFEPSDDESEISGDDEKDIAAFQEARQAVDPMIRVAVVEEMATRISAEVDKDAEKVIVEQTDVHIDVVANPEFVEQDKTQSSPGPVQDQNEQPPSPQEEVIAIEQAHSSYRATTNSPGKPADLKSSPPPRSLQDQSEDVEDKMELAEEHHESVATSFLSQVPSVISYNLSQSSDVGQLDEEDVAITEPQTDVPHEDSSLGDEVEADLPDVSRQLQREEDELIEEEMENAPASQRPSSSSGSKDEVSANRTAYKGFSDSEAAAPSLPPTTEQVKSPAPQKDLQASMTTVSSRVETQNTEQLLTPLETQPTEPTESFLEEKDDLDFVTEEDEEVADEEFEEMSDDEMAETVTANMSDSQAEQQTVDAVTTENVDSALDREDDIKISDEEEDRDMVDAQVESKQAEVDTDVNVPDDKEDQDIMDAQTESKQTDLDGDVDVSDDEKDQDMADIEPEAVQQESGADAESSGEEKDDIAADQPDSTQQEDVDDLEISAEEEDHTTEPQPDPVQQVIIDDDEDAVELIPNPPPDSEENTESSNDQGTTPQEETLPTKEEQEAGSSDLNPEQTEMEDLKDALELPVSWESPGAIPNDQSSFITAHSRASESREPPADETEETIMVKPKRRGRSSKNADAPATAPTVATRSKPRPLDSDVGFARSAVEFKRGQRNASDKARINQRMTRNMSGSVKKSASPEHQDASAELASAALLTPAKKKPTKASTVNTSASRWKTDLTKRLSSEMPECVSLKKIRLYNGRRLDTAAVVTSVPPEPKRTSSRQYALSFNVTDPSTASDQVVEVRFFRAHKDYLPIVKPGDSILLRGFTVVAIRGKNFGLQTHDESSWAVFDSNEDNLAQIRGPPVEMSDEEKIYMVTMRSWYEDLDDAAKGKIEKANQAFAKVK